MARNAMLDELREVRALFTRGFTTDQLINLSSFSGNEWRKALTKNREFVAIKEGVIFGVKVPERLQHRVYETFMHTGSMRIKINDQQQFQQQAEELEIDTRMEAVATFPRGEAIWFSRHEVTDEFMNERGYFKERDDLIDINWESIDT